jgi:hypothetical protein
MLNGHATESGGSGSSAAMMWVESPIARPSRNRMGSVPRPVARQARIR